ncbi:MAG TPA: hypothetical protein DCX06_00440 [Opitutae bacterium]|nr:hypothetical protein [Opitutae bacterium]
MPNLNQELKSWHDWTHPDFFQPKKGRESRILPLFFRQLLPIRFQKTRLTLIGWILILVAMGIGSAAYNTSSNILFMTLSLLLSTLVLSGILSLINFKRLKWDLCAPEHLQVDEVGMAEVSIVNEKSIFPTMSICFTVGSSATREDERLYLKNTLAAGAAGKLEWTFIPQQRGRCDVYLSGVTSQFPFGFLEKVMGHEVRETVLVWPAQIEYSFKPISSGQRFISGITKRNPGLGNDLLNLRPYQAGDPPRLVHWKATARLGKLMIRQLAQEGEAGFHLILDADATSWGEVNFETLCSVTCSLADDLFHAGRLETVSISGQMTLAVKSLRDLHDFYDALAMVERKPSASHEVSVKMKNRITFRPLGERGVAIYVDEQKTGEAEG